MSTPINENLKSSNTWLRIVFMLIFVVLIGFVRILLWAVVLFQTVMTLLTGSSNPHALKFGGALAAYLYRILLFLTFNSEEKPFPFNDWESSSRPGPTEPRMLEK